MNDKVELADDGQDFNTKIHAFKNYFCYRHDYWFSVDLFTDSSSADLALHDSKTHKMRMSPFTRIDNLGVISRFFAAMAFDDEMPFLVEDAAAAVTTASSDDDLDQ
ncbi:hypothetical protein GNI_000980 [Gregarina niphandrodes]|uniref:Uncharacterized protein n=1 Tax=Gregarina niphandrodes TaxID=110365 RepID=A0A023BDW4_GRENI|nr:hypothetical protein GNI_000980 [Gregarina niphandrodes]EZG89698.1 hypothetical protein GNI_000980 [Gregarina niphandrodes]|eukprot:XP_011128454.1 hypothetical protein GNI_000980 [Gregarina niphandrodes]